MDITNHIEASAEVHGKQCKVTLSLRQGRKTTPWLAHGMYRNVPLEGQGNSPQAALEHWESKARMVGDVP